MKNIFKYFLIFFAAFAFYSETFAQDQKAGTGFKYQKWHFLYEEKCSKCHTLERVFAEEKTKNEWEYCVTRMMQISPSWITPEDKEIIINEIFGTKSETIIPFHVRKKYGKDKLIFIDRCAKCHTLTQILCENKTKEEWKETVLRMRDIAPELFNEKDIPVIVDFLAEKDMLMKEDVAAKIMVNKCLICHEWDRILLVRKSREEWEECVNDMRIIAKKTLKKDWFSHHEFHTIVDLLVKTQRIYDKE